MQITGLVAFLLSEDGLAVVAALDDVAGVVRKDDSTHPWHGGSVLFTLLGKIAGGPICHLFGRHLFGHLLCGSPFYFAGR